MKPIEFLKYRYLHQLQYKHEYAKLSYSVAREMAINCDLVPFKEIERMEHETKEEFEKNR